jgi:NAD-dependent dihydropyrimidine dehydrogenase PreA subunit
MKEKGFYAQKSDKAAELKSFIKELGVDLVGIADLHSLKGMPLGLSSDAAAFLGHYHCAIVMGAQLGKLGKSASGPEVSLFLEKAALAVVDRLERKGRRVLIVHTEDEFDPVKRVGLVSLKVLAKAAGLGWQGRSLVIVSPKYGPIHRWIGVLTDMKLRGDTAIPNQCGDCALCVEECPAGALNLVEFDDHPACREDVLDIGLCKGDDGCTECLTVCPWIVQD